MSLTGPDRQGPTPVLVIALLIRLVTGLCFFLLALWLRPDAAKVAPGLVAEPTVGDALVSGC
jgi:hypothetical protein